MRRLIAGLTGTLVISAVTAAVLSPAAPSLAAAPQVSLVLSPPEGQEYVKGSKSGQTEYVSFSGQVTPPDSSRPSAYLRFEGSNGQRCRVFGGGQDDLRVTNFLVWDGQTGQISGSYPLPGLGSQNQTDPGCHGGRVILRATFVDPQPPFEETTAVSNPVPIDIAGPTLGGSHLTAPDTIKILFSEPVHLKGQPDLPSDWEVDGVPPLGISGSGDSRTLTVAPSQGEDATPDVRYLGVTRSLPERETYSDTSANNKWAEGESSQMFARDLIKPRVPDITSIAGQSGTSEVGSDPTPEIRVSNLTSTHFAELYLETNDTTGLQRPGDSFVGQDQADGSGIAEITSADLVSDGNYTFYVIARDNALCDPPDDGGDEARCPNWSDADPNVPGSQADPGSTATYFLDRLAPRLVFSAVTGAGEVTVGFSEAIFGSNNINNWTVTGAGPVTAVTGSGDRRVLAVLGANPGANITYTPGDYADEAGNSLPSFTDNLLDALPPLVETTDPGQGSIYVSAATYDMKGTAERADEVHVFRDQDNSGTPDDPTAIASGPVAGDGTWTISVPLLQDTQNRFVVRGIRTTAGVSGPHERVDGLLVQDSVDPTLTLEPLSGVAFSDQQFVLIRWNASDVNFPPNPISIEYSNDGGATWVTDEESPVANAAAPREEPGPPCTQPCFEWRPDENVNTKTALIRLTARDQAGRSKSAQTSLFEIDSIEPIFTATILTATQILVGFSEPVTGLLSPTEWTISGQQVAQIEPAGPVSNQMSAKLTLAPTAGQIDPSQQNPVTYTPTSDQADLVDHVGNSIVRNAVQGPGGGGPGGSGGSFTAEASAANACTIFGTDGPDVITGTDGPDIICPSNGDDHINAMGGNDIILPGLGAKTIDGGEGNDEINGGPDNDTLIGGIGADLLVGDNGTDSLLGGDGDDIILGGDGTDSIDGGSGMDVLEGEADSDDISGGPGIDHIFGGDGDDTISGGDDDDRLTGDAGNDALRGGDGDDALEGGDGNDLLEGESGDDELLGGDGKDQLLGDGGNDRIDGGEGNDRLSGDAGNDRLEGGKHDDRIDGGDGNDSLFGSEGKDTMLGQDGNDKLFGSDDNDSMYGGTGNDQLSGEAGRDKLLGGSSRDKLLGGSGRDRLDGGTGRDFCDGGTAPDSKLGCEGGPSK